MAASQEILPQDLPDDLLEEHPQQNAVVKSSQADSMPTQSLSSQNPISAAQWFELLEEWTDNALIEGKEDLFAQTIPLLERTMLNCALKYTNGHKQEAARLLGWGRNTLTRKLKELGIE